MEKINMNSDSPKILFNTNLKRPSLVISPYILGKTLKNKMKENKNLCGQRLKGGFEL